MYPARFKYLIVPLLALLLLSFKPDDKFVRKAMRYLEKGNLKEAQSYYNKALAKNPDNYKANLGMGLLLSELLSNYNGAQPYLEKAYQITEKDTVPALMYALAKCYQHNGEFDKALSFFGQLKGWKDVEEEIDLDKDIEKRKADCIYAMQHSAYTPPTNWYLINAGKSINTDMPEYVPVLTPQNELIFTSRRKDDEKEQLSYLDGKYFESMYITQMGPSGFNPPRRYTLPDQYLNSKYLKNHESVVSMSPDGSKLFTFHDNKIYEINMDERASKKPKKLLKTVNFDYYQNHAFLTRDGQTLYFTSEAKGGLGGLDIYIAHKESDGNWSKPENIGAPINTEMDEDAPFLTEDGKTMYFASTGHEGFGNFDIYKTQFADGKWSSPENMGRPINSPGHDIFMVIDSRASIGYFSSSRSGGYGDMDIYKINYLDNMNKECPPQTVADLQLRVTDPNPDDFTNKVEWILPLDYKVLSYEWRVNDKSVDNPRLVLENKFPGPGTYTISSKIIAYCDTCLSPVIACRLIETRVEHVLSDTILATKEPFDPAKSVSTGKTKGEPKTKGGSSKSKGEPAGTKGELKAEELASLGFDTQPILFDFAKSNLREDARKILDHNAEILKNHPGLKVEITGYTDSRGPQLVNKILSAQRAKAVKDFLTAAGVKKSQIKFLNGKGADEFVNDCGKDKDCDEAAHQQNRRVEFRVYNP
jgi:outer membrane protein OmpA-like peptidoglycan-associated protein/tetratricopeptide (TPR) repeat protein